MSAKGAPQITIEATATLIEAAQLLRDHQLDRVPVLLGGRAVGVITELAIGRTAAAEDADPHTAKVSDFMESHSNGTGR